MGLAVAAPTSVFAGAHTWDVNEWFSNADGTIQFIEIQEANGTPNETGVGNCFITSNARSYDIPNNVASPTTNKYLLFATPAFAALPGAPTPDFLFPAGQVPFFATTGDTLRYSPYDTRTFGAGVLPTDGVHSLSKLLAVQVNSPTNYAGQTGSVDASPAPPGVPAGSVTVAKLDSEGSNLAVSFDSATCTGDADYQILYGDKSQLPASPAGAFAVAGAACAIGGTSPYAWSSVPSAADGSGLLWWIVVATNGGSKEGSWGDDGDGAERLGPGSGGSSGQCGVTTRDLGNACGH